MVQRVLFSVSDKRGLEDFAMQLQEINPATVFIASGGTGEVLAKAGIAFTPLSEITTYPECFGGRVKTLHPKIFGGILLRQDRDEQEAKELDIAPIDLVVVNLYPFPEKDAEEFVESLDIGGSALLRSACKNYQRVALVTDPEDYGQLLDELKGREGEISLETRERLAVKGMKLSAAYENRLAQEFAKRLAKEEIQTIHLQEGRKLVYGENPDQEGWVYSQREGEGVAAAKILGGKELSYNNYEDASQAFLALQRMGKGPLVAIVKHGSLCGFATGRSQEEAFAKAWEGDSKSAYGSIVALSECVGEEFSQEIKGKFIELLIAPAFSPAFVRWVISAKPSLRLLEVSFKDAPKKSYRSIAGGMLVQTAKENLLPSLHIATKKGPEPEQIGLFHFALIAVQSIKSNAIALVRAYAPGYYQLIGVGGGQPNRVDSLQRLALPKAAELLAKEVGEEKLQQAFKEVVLASDAFFPFADAIESAAAQGIRTCIQPGGSIRDEEVIEAADRHDFCMVFTHQRYFSH